MGFFKLPKDRIMDKIGGKSFLDPIDILNIHNDAMYLDNSDKLKILNRVSSQSVKYELEREFFPQPKLLNNYTEPSNNFIASKPKLFEYSPPKPLFKKNYDLFNSNTEDDSPDSMLHIIKKWQKVAVRASVFE